MTVEFRLARRDDHDAEAFCDLSNSLYARKVAPPYFFWQFHDGPNTPALATAWDGGRMVGAYGVHVCPADATRPGRAMTLDNMVAEDFQGRGLVRDLASMALDHAQANGAQAVCVVANARSLRAHQRHFGWSLWATLRDWQATGADPRSGAMVQPIETPDEALAARRDRVFYARTLPYLAWRTQTNPRYRYQWVEAHDGGRRLGQACTKLFRDPTTGEGFGDVVALHPEADDDTGALLAAVRRWFAGQSVETVVLYPVGEREEAVCASLGFEPTARERFVVGRGDRPAGLDWGMLDVDVY